MCTESSFSKRFFRSSIIIPAAETASECSTFISTCLSVFKSAPWWAGWPKWQVFHCERDARIHSLGSTSFWGPPLVLSTLMSSYSPLLQALSRVSNSSLIPLLEATSSLASSQAFLRATVEASLRLILRPLLALPLHHSSFRPGWSRTSFFLSSQKSFSSAALPSTWSSIHFLQKNSLQSSQGPSVFPSLDVSCSILS